MDYKIPGKTKGILVGMASIPGITDHGVSHERIAKFLSIGTDSLAGASLRLAIENG